ncbi:IS3 family transposase [Streptomyces chartreusis]|uniref:IS3 family transposase n=1 Tax=Streptomyces chartreusis TaxID=1969 RepID=UPI0036B746A7
MSESWFYKHRSRRPTGREVRRQQLAEAVAEVFTQSGGTYGSPKIWITLMRQGWRVSVNTIAKLMAELGLVAGRVGRRGGAAPAGQTARRTGLRVAGLHRRGARSRLVRGHDGDRHRRGQVVSGDGH